MAQIGVISQKESLIESIVKWSIKDFLSLPHKVNSFYFSPLFSFADEDWFLRIYPNREIWDGTEGFIVLFLLRSSTGPRMEIEITFGVKTVDGKLDPEIHYTEDFDGHRCCSSFLLRRPKLLKRKSDLLPTDTLTLVCRMKRKGINEVASSSSTVPAKCTYCDKALAAQEDIQCHLRKCEDLLIYCQNCSNGVTIKKWYEHKCQMTDTEDDCVVCQDFKRMLSDGQNYDLTLKVGDKELRAHQDVLKARCRVFDSMLRHDTAEKKSGVIDIPDCDPQAMVQFLLYVYCGKVETLNEKDMLGLYYIADKYDMQDLKQKCCDFIKKSLSHTNICKIIQLALTHSDAGLLEHATEYFMDNTVVIMVTVEWQNFMKDNTTVANELMLKSFEKKEQQILN